MPTKSKLPDRRWQAGKLPGLPSLSPMQLALRWKCREREAIDYIRTGVLRAHALVAGLQGRNAEGDVVPLEEGYYSLSPGDAHERLAGPRPSHFGPLHLVAPDGTEFTIAREYVRRADIRVLLEDVERFETGTDRDPKAFIEAIQKGQARGGRAPKRLPGIYQRVLDLLGKNPQITVSEAWKSFPLYESGNTDDLIYRDDEKLVEVDDHTGRDRAIGWQAFRRYVTNARKELRTRT